MASAAPSLQNRQEFLGAEAKPVATVLLIDDDLPVAKSMARQVKLWGHRPVYVSDGESGLAVLAAEPVELVIVDGKMPGMDGIEFIRRVRSDPKTAAIPIVLFTALPHVYQHAVSEGADDCWT